MCMCVYVHMYICNIVLQPTSQTNSCVHNSPTMSGASDGDAGGPPKKRRGIQAPGGYLQKASWHGVTSLSGSSTDSASHLAKALITKWAWGEMSAPMLQTIAMAAHMDGNNHWEVKAMSQLGTLESILEIATQS